MPHYTNSTITKVSELIRQQKVSPVELVTECLARIARLQPQLNAFITITADQAMQDAAIAERDIQNGNWKGPLHGIPVGLKDFFDTAGIRTTAAFAPFKDRVPTKDAEVVTRLKDAGAIILGKLNMHELGAGTTSVISYFGPVHNPWHTDYVAGGSSGGSAAAIAAGLCFATVDTDAVGSCRLPAACCGVTGFKPTYGLLSTKGILEGEPADEFILNLAHTAFTCRTAGDAAILLQILASPQARQNQSHTTPSTTSKAKIGIVKNFKATDEIRTTFLHAGETFQALGYTTQEIDAPLTIPSFDFTLIEEQRQAMSQSLFHDVNVLLLPTTTDLPPTIEAATAGGPQAVSPDNTFFCNYYALPAISIPCGFSQTGLPIGLQIVGPRESEGIILEAARTFQQATQWHLKHPPLD